MEVGLRQVFLAKPMKYERYFPQGSVVVKGGGKVAQPRGQRTWACQKLLDNVYNIQALYTPILFDECLLLAQRILLVLNPTGSERFELY